jgi:hypothetical protein
MTIITSNITGLNLKIKQHRMPGRIKNIKYSDNVYEIL